MVKMKVVMDEEKIKSQGEYNVSTIKEQLKKSFGLFDIVETEENIYTGNEEDESYMALVSIFLDCEWFMNNVKEWIWIDEEDDYIEDLLA